MAVNQEVIGASSLSATLFGARLWQGLPIPAAPGHFSAGRIWIVSGTDRGLWVGKPRFATWRSWDKPALVQPPNVARLHKSQDYAMVTIRDLT